MNPSNKIKAHFRRCNFPNCGLPASHPFDLRPNGKESMKSIEKFISSFGYHSASGVKQCLKCADIMRVTNNGFRCDSCGRFVHKRMRKKGKYY